MTIKTQFFEIWRRAKSQVLPAMPFAKGHSPIIIALKVIKTLFLKAYYPLEI